MFVYELSHGHTLLVNICAMVTCHTRKLDCISYRLTIRSREDAHSVARHYLYIGMYYVIGEIFQLNDKFI